MKTLVLAVFGMMVLTLNLTDASSATVLCKTNTNTEACGEKYGMGTQITFKLRTEFRTQIQTEFKTIECNKSTLGGKTSSAGSWFETIKGSVETLTFEECNCEVKVLKNGTFEIHHIPATDNGTLTGNGQEVTVTCSTIFGNVHCIYVTESSDFGTIAGSGTTPSIEIRATFFTLTTNMLCSFRATWEGIYHVSTPVPLYVTEA